MPADVEFAVVDGAIFIGYADAVKHTKVLYGPVAAAPALVALTRAEAGDLYYVIKGPS